MRRATVLFLSALAMLANGYDKDIIVQPSPVFPPDAVIDVTKPPYNAHPEPGFDNTAAIQRAISDNVDSGRTLFFPTGTYEIRDTLVCKNTKGLWRGHITFQGQGPGRDREQGPFHPYPFTILKLTDHAAGFDDPAKPKSMLMTGSMEEPGDSPTGGGNKAHRNNIFDLTIDTGSGNSGAMGIEYAVSNQGSIKNVIVMSGDGAGVGGIVMKRPIPGPGLLKNVTIEGFDVGIDIDGIQYGITLEDITLKGQRVAGIRNGENLLFIRHLNSDNKVPALQVTKPNGMTVLLGGQLKGGSPDQAALESTGSVLVRDITTEGYRKEAINVRGLTGGGGTSAVSLIKPPEIGNESGGLAGLLPVEETPDYVDNDISHWEAVRPRREDETDDTAAIQRAFDSGKSTIWFPNRDYVLSDTVVMRGAVRQVLGMGSRLGTLPGPFSDLDHPRAMIRLDPTTASSVFVENFFFNAPFVGALAFENNTPATVVIKDCVGGTGKDGWQHGYSNTEKGTGKLFLEDVSLPGWVFNGQEVWARQLNPENYEGDGKQLPQVLNNGGKLWLLGFKTEGAAPFIVTQNHGVTELLGAYNYISATKPPAVNPDAVPYIVTDSQAALTFVTDNFRESDYRVYIRETQGGKVREWKGADLPTRDGQNHDDVNYRMRAVPLWRSGG